MASPIAGILRRFSEKFREKAAQIAATLAAVTAASGGQSKEDTSDAVDRLWEASGMAAVFSDGVKDAVKEAYEENGRKSLTLLPSLQTAWDPSGMTLSQKLHTGGEEMREAIVSTIQTQLRANGHCIETARKLYDGYDSGQAVTERHDIPKYLKKVVDFARRSELSKAEKGDMLAAIRKAERQIGKLGLDGAPNQALKTAYKDVLGAAQDGAEKALVRAVHTAVEEKSRYIAERIARTESARAWADGFVEKYGGDDAVVAYEWKLGSRHPKSDICDLYASADLYGLGRGIYPKDKTPRLPVHPHCLCHLAPVFASELKGKKEKDNLEEGGRAWLERQPLHKRQRILGISGYKRFEQGESWTQLARNYSGEKLSGRVGNIPESLKEYVKDGKIKIAEVSIRRPDETSESFERRIRDYIASPYCTKAVTDKQLKHLKDNPSYIEGRSYYESASVLEGIDLAKMLNEGRLQTTHAGNWSKRVIVRHDDFEGTVVYRNGGTVRSHYSTVHIGDKGVHLVPKEVE